eukprot:5160512-Amphidinium_carterae.2
MLDPASAADLLDVIRMLEGETPPAPPQIVSDTIADSTPEDTVEMVDTPLWRLPSAADLEHMPSFDALQQHMVLTQKLLPKSLVHTLANAMNWLLTTADDPHQTDEIRSRCLRIFLLAPRILWPAPGKISNGSRLKQTTPCSSSQWTME